MSNIAKDLIMEGLADEFYDDPDYAVEWLIEQGYAVDGLAEIDLCDLFVEVSLPFVMEI